ncbi:MAG: hypothetical protein CMI55_02500 [Parcubacteria group bacterium]|jgi:hypothetical protein|nr:hypothetical protein [Parcubacteria group bacterium]|tara:strand:- start:9058 stop:9402 length:345 start_codon:yes stop_codon:yes gene_type:complete
MKRFDELDQFKKEFKKLFKKHKTLDDDFKKFKKVLFVYPTGIGKNFVIIHSSGNIKLVKAHMACRALRNNHLLRIIYSYFEQEQRFEFIELYFKGNKENEDKKRIKQYLQGCFL